MYKVIKYITKVTFLSLFILQSTKSFAAINIDPKVAEAFKGTYASLGYFVNTGNTGSQTLNIKGVVSYLSSINWLNVGTATYDTSKDRDKGLITNKLFLDFNSVKYLDNISGLYGNINYTHDSFSGYKYVINESLGYSIILYKTNVWLVNGEIGPGLQQRKEDKGSEKSESLFAGNLILHSKYTYNENTSWEEKFKVTTTKNNTLFALDSSIDSRLYKNLSLRASYLINYDTKPLPDKYKFNSQAMISFVYDIF